jgi:PE family
MQLGRHVVAQLNFGSGFGNGFSIDLADAQKFVQALEDLLASLIHTWETYGERLQVLPPGHDDYSAAWANQAQATIESYKTWNKQMQQTVFNMINNMNATIASYQQTEQHNTMGS